MRDHRKFESTYPGRVLIPGGLQHRLRISPDEGQFGGHGCGGFANCEGGITLINFGPFPYNNFELTETKTNSSTITATAGGIKLQTQATPSDGDDVSFKSVRTFTPVAGSSNGAMRYQMSTRVQVSSAANMGLAVGFVTSSATAVASTAPADGIYFVKAKNSTALVGRTVQNSGTAHSTGTLATVADATDLVLTVHFEIGTSAATSSGAFWVNGVRTPFTAAQITDIYNMVAGTPTLCAFEGCVVNGTTQRSATVSYCVADIDRSGNFE